MRISLAAELTGYSVQAIETKIRRGVWIERSEYVRAPDGAVLIDMEGYERWALGGATPQRPTPEAEAATLRLSDEELFRLTDYLQPAKQVEALHAQGFWRARRSPVSGRVILERAHFEAVCAGETVTAQRRMPARALPQLQPAD